MLRNQRSMLVAVLLLALWACGPGPASPDAPRPPEADLSLLFIGNSLTYTNGLPGMLERLLEEHGGVDDAYVESVSLPNFGLEDHWNGLSNARQRIEAGGWDVIILQQGPSATEGRPSLIEYSGRFAAEIHSLGARTALYMVWPAEERSFDFAGVSDSYRTAAEQVGGVLYPVGEAWRAAWAGDPSLELYGPDRFHPSPVGTYLAAVVMFEQLSGIDPETLPGVIPSAIGGLPLSAADAAIVHAAAKEANEAFATP